MIGRPDWVTGRIDWLEPGVDNWCEEFRLVLNDVPGLATCEMEFSSIIDSGGVRRRFDSKLQKLEDAFG